MDQLDWQIIHLLYKEKNVTKTAEKLYLSQPALTYRIKSIEKKLNTTIIHRSKKGITFTQEGEYVAEQAKLMVDQYNHLKNRLQKSPDDEGTIRIGVSTNFARFKLSIMLEAFLQTYPKVKFDIITTFSKSILEMAEKGTIHIAIIRGDFDWKHKKILLKQEPICIISKEPITVEQLPYQPRIMFKTDPNLQQTIDTWWKQNFSVPPKVTMQMNTIETCTEMVENGLGYAIVPSVSIHNKQAPYQLPLLDENQNIILRDTWLLQQHTNEEHPIINMFVSSIKDMFDKDSRMNTL